MEGGFGDPMGDKAVLLCVYLSFCVEHKFVMKGRLRDFLVCSFVTHVAASIFLDAFTWAFMQYTFMISRTHPTRRMSQTRNVGCLH